MKNLVVNGDFSSGDITGWKASHNDLIDVITVDNDYCVKMTPMEFTDDEADLVILSQVIKTEPGQYKVTFKTRTEFDDDSGIQLPRGIFQIDPITSQTEYPVRGKMFVVIKSTEFTEWTFTFELPDFWEADFTEIKFYIQNNPSDQSFSPVLVDSIEIVKVAD